MHKGYEKVALVREEFASVIKREAEEHLLRARQAIHRMDLETGKKEMDAAVALDPKVDRLELAKKEYEEAKQVLEMVGPKPENSPWDGSVRPVVSYLRDRLVDPRSVEYMEWSEAVLADVDAEKFWAVRVKYRAKNSFGGYVIEEKLALIQHGAVLAMTDY